MKHGTINEKRKVMYIDIDGVLVSLSKPRGNERYPILVPDAIKFLEWVIKTGFKCKYLTCWREQELIKEFPQLPKFEHIKWRNLKTEGINFRESFYWLEDGCISDEYDVLKEKKALDSYIYIDPDDDNFLTKIMETYENK